jgi:hypothetical protein
VNIKILLSVILLAGVFIVSSPLLAHHGASAYDMSNAVEIKNATVTKFSWMNPHTLIYFDAADAGGKINHWAVETGSPTAITVLGWSRNTLKVGDVITIWVFQSKTGVPVGRLNKLQFADGRLIRDTQTGGERGERADDGLR